MMNASVKLLQSVLPASVSVRTSVPAAHPSAQILGTERMGSGTLIDDGGIVLTVNYIVLGAEEIHVTLLTGTTLSGEIVAQDFYSGLAAVKIPGDGYPAVRTDSSAELQTGQEIFILASAGEADRRVNGGVVSSLAPFDAYWEYHLERGILTTAMNPGLGGGALLTLNGRLTGVVSLDLNEIGRFSLAIPIEYFLDHQHELLRHGRRVTRPARAWVGLFCYVLHQHVVVAGVLPGAPGERAGLKPGDVILAVDGNKINERRILYRHLWSRKPGEVITFQVFRNNTVRHIPVTSTNAEAFFA